MRLEVAEGRALTGRADDESILATNAAKMRRLLVLLTGRADDDTLTWLAATALRMRRPQRQQHPHQAQIRPNRSPVGRHVFTVTGMNEQLRLASLTAFYFGPRVATDPTSADSITTISKRAYRDLSRTLHGIGTHPNKADLMEDTHASLHTFVTDLEKVTNREEFDDLHDTWCLKRMEVFNSFHHTQRGKKFEFTYGQAQKWINMTLKYLAVLNHPAVARVYGYLHVPIDSIVYAEAEHPSAGITVPRPPGNVSWSRLNCDQYRKYQQQLQTAIATHNADEIAPLDWEAQAWITRSSSSSQSK